MKWTTDFRCNCLRLSVNGYHSHGSDALWYRYHSWWMLCSTETTGTHWKLDRLCYPWQDGTLDRKVWLLKLQIWDPHGWIKYRFSGKKLIIKNFSSSLSLLGQLNAMAQCNTHALWFQKQKGISSQWSSLICSFFFCFCFVFFETGCLCIALAVLELTL